MAKTRRRRRKETTSGYFRKIFEEQPRLLNETSNDLLIDRWKREHPTHSERELKKARANLANLKSLLRKKERDSKTSPNARVRPMGGSRPTLETLEEHIDDGLTLAKNLDREGLGDVLVLLRRARNLVVWKLGQA